MWSSTSSSRGTTANSTSKKRYQMIGILSILILQRRNFFLSFVAILSAQQLFFGYELVRHDSAPNTPLYTTKTDQYVQDMIDWVHTKGGFVNEKVEIRRSNPADDHSYYGMFAKKNISKKEIILDIPHECVIGLDNTRKNKYYKDLCSLARKLLHEINLGPQSEYAPFVKYLADQPYGQLPATYSPAGKGLLLKIVGNPGHSSLPPYESSVNWIHDHFDKSCIQQGDDYPSQEHAVALVAQRGWDTVLCPLFDMINHHNGLINTESTSVYDSKGFKVRSTKEILAGEEVYSTYDKCLDCGDTASYWGTPEIFREYGFVETYPQRWFFAKSKNMPRIAFEISQVSRNGVSSLEVSWIRGHSPKQDGLKFLKDHKERLDKVYHDYILPSKEGDVVPKNEWSMIAQYHSAMGTAISLAIQTSGSELFPVARAAREKEVWG